MSLTIEHLANALFDHLANRRISKGVELLNSQRRFIERITADASGAAVFFRKLAGWMEYSPVAAEASQRLAQEFAQPGRDLLMSDACRVRLGMALVSYHQEADAEAQAHARWVIDNAESWMPAKSLDGILGSAQFLLARGLKRQAKYPAALTAARASHRHYRRAGLPLMVAVVQATEAWLLTQQGEKEAAQSLRTRARTRLRGCDDWNVLASIAFGEGREARRAIADEAGLKLFEDAAALYRRSAPPHRNLPRVLIEMANIYTRLAAASAEPAAAKQRECAAALLEEADRCTHKKSGQHRNRNRLLLAKVNFELYGPHPALYKMQANANEARRLARKQKDRLMEARALYKLAQIGTYSAVMTHEDRAPGSRLIEACGLATEALELAKQLSNRRLLARLYVLRGIIYLEPPFHDPSAAAGDYDSAVEAMEGMESEDFLVERIRDLEIRLNKAHLLSTLEPD